MIIAVIDDTDPKYVVAISVSMGSQLMNSILYIGEYAIQCKTPGNINYPTDEFPLGPFATKRLLFYCNGFWTIMPAYSIIMLFLQKTI